MSLNGISSEVIAAVLSAIVIAIGVALWRWLSNTRKILVWCAQQMANDGNGSWRSSVDKRLTAIEAAMPGVSVKSEPPTKPPLTK